MCVAHTIEHQRMQRQAMRRVLDVEASETAAPEAHDMPDEEWYTMQDLDTEAGRAKGTAFRTFKRIREGLAEGRDFIVLEHYREDPLGARLVAAERIYPSSVHPVLLAPDAAHQVLAKLNDPNWLSR